LNFTRAIASDSSLAWKTVDQHHYDSLCSLLSTHNLSSLWPNHIVRDLSLIWHRLDPWPDTCAGLTALNDLGVETVTLTNGNLTLIQDMVEYSGMPFTHVFSAEMFDSYKPNPSIYLGAASRLGLKPEECAMVAAHLDDLKGAKACGFRTIYVERPEEERYPELKGEEGLVDLWVAIGEEGFVEAARNLARSS
jgi:2-haloacid dehalogenase